MPIYGYRCQACDQEFEATQRMSDPAVAACPACGGAGRRLFFPAGIVFKGGGFYKTDSRSASVAASPAGENGKKPEPSSEGAATKPATKESPSTSTPAAPPAPAKPWSSSSNASTTTSTPTATP